MAARGLIDTGAIIAFLNRDDRWHQRAVEAMANLHLPLATSAAVLTEVFHLIGRFPLHRAVVRDFLRSDAITILPIDDADLPELEALMDRYADRPMGFADATLVRLAEREALTTVFTIDRDDFETYRIGGRRRFRIVGPVTARRARRVGAPLGGGGARVRRPRAPVPSARRSRVHGRRRVDRSRRPRRSPRADEDHACSKDRSHGMPTHRTHSRLRAGGPPLQR